MRKNFFRTLPKLPFSVLLWVALAIGLLVSVLLLGQKYHWPEDLMTTLRTLIVFLIGLRIIADIKRVLENDRAAVLARIALGEDEPVEALSWKDSVTGVYIINITLYAGLILLVIFAVGGTLSGFLVSGTLLSVMLGVAGQSFFANFFGGLAIAIFKPFELGDHVQLIAWQLPLMAETYPHETRSQGYRGFIRDINLFYSDIRLDDGRLLRIPNGVVTNAGILRIQHGEWLRTSFRFDVPLDCDVPRLLTAIQEVADKYFAPDETVDVQPSLEAARRLESAPPVPRAVEQAAHARVAAAPLTHSDRPLYWHPPEILLVDVSLTAAAVEVHGSVLQRRVQHCKDAFLREVLGRLVALRARPGASA